ncbi:MAG: epimerase [Cellulomonas sp. 73-92]|uniref:NAD-dependent epimerase/dehydratase family protein n=1 Tax=Cellulomonas sp. 73-92 TaxID=1895740 RepID=UPI000925D8B2|nr:NAD-dependent epimerase/dehydratase family protein [Cellulomonas sp. 73-92]OJV75006.1 MAG: epimerase [Cellulomonas sp. 73-92]
MRIVVIGATGHVGTYLVPQLVREGHEVVAVSRGESLPYQQSDAWGPVERVIADRGTEESAGTFGDRIAALGADAVVDMICFTEPSARQLVDALRGRVAQLVSVGTIWTHGTLTEVPVTEDAPKHPWGDYGTQKAAIERLLLEEARADAGLQSAIVHPGHISGPGWPVVTPQGTLDLNVWRSLATGAELVLPHFGLETLHHVHPADVAQLIRLCLENPTIANGEAFWAVSPQALTLRGYAEAVAGWYGRTARLRFASFDEFLATVPEQFRDAAYQHIARSHSMSTDKGRRLLGYEPAYTSLAAVAEAVDWLQRNGELPDLPSLRQG